MSTVEYDFEADVSLLSATELRQKYTSEANSHRNMLMRGNSLGKKIAPEFQEFRSFLKHVGPKPAKSATLDRTNNADPEYAPNKVRWADKKTQNSNKGDSLLFHCSSTNQTYTTAQLAGKQGVSKQTIRKRRERGWTDTEIISGKHPQVSSTRLTLGPPNPELIGLAASRISHAQVSEEMRAKIKVASINGTFWHLGKTGELLRQFNSRDRRSSAADVIWQDHEDNAIYCRKDLGEEYFLPTYDEAVESFSDVPGVHIQKDSFDKRHWDIWLETREHVIIENLKPHQLAYLAELKEKFEPTQTNSQVSGESGAADHKPKTIFV